mgnify:CR=1 FL=1
MRLGIVASRFNEAICGKLVDGDAQMDVVNPATEEPLAEIARARNEVRSLPGHIEGLEREYLLLEYAEGDELYVPIHQTDRITRYVGADDHPPALSRLGSAEWQTVKSRTQQAVEVVAKEKRATTRKAAPAVEYQTPTNEEGSTCYDTPPSSC